MRRFTLIELILAVIIIALAGAMTASIVGAVSQHGNRSELIMNRAGELHNICEKVRATYKKSYKGDLESLRSLIGTAGNMNNSFGEYVVLESKYIEFEDADSTDPGGVWNEIESTDSTSDYYQTALKVRIKHSSGQETITMVFIDEEAADDIL